MSEGIQRVEHASELQAVRALFREYAESLDLDLEAQGFSDELAGLPGRYAPPAGCILLATVDERPAGCVALRPLCEGVCEMKRLYVRPNYRRSGLGRRLAERVIQEARAMGYGLIRLDTVPAMMAKAVALYRALGFQPSAPYGSTPLPGIGYMELKL